MTVLNYNDLLKIYPDIPNECRTPNGIDLRLGKLERIDDDRCDTGVILNEKFLPKTSEANWVDKTIKGRRREKLWVLEPGMSYIATVLDKTNIRPDCIELYRPRSSLIRCGIRMDSGVGDAGYQGNLSFLLTNITFNNFYIKKGTRFAQAIVLKMTGEPDILYDGDYQKNKHVEEENI